LDRAETKFGGCPSEGLATLSSVTTRTIAPRTARYVRLEVTDSEQGSASGAARIYEFEVYGSAAAPPPPPLVAYAAADATGRSQRFEAGSYDVIRGNLGLIGNDAARAVDVEPGYQATICRDTPLTTGTSGRP
jgi:hypothetical protein